MSMPSPFELGAAIGGNVGGAIQGASDTGNINKILQQAAQANDPQNMDNMIGQILQSVSPQNREAAFKMLQQQKDQVLAQQQRAGQQRFYQSKGLGEDFANLPEKERQILLSQQEKGEEKGLKELMVAKDLVSRQMQHLKSGHLGPKVGGLGKTGRKAGSTWSKEGNKIRAEYAQIGKQLIGMATTLPIKNKEEFVTLSEKLIDPTLSREEIEGTLNALQLRLDSALNLGS